MSNIKSVGGEFYVSQMLKPNEVDSIKREGIKGVICNLPDGEFPSKSHAEIKSAVEKAGLKFVYAPVTHGGLEPKTISDIQGFARQVSGKILAFCRSGARSEISLRAAKLIK